MNKEALKQNLGFDKFTELQESAFKSELFENKIIISPTGTGKTVGFLILAHRFLEINQNSSCLILSPTRELAIQIHTAFKAFRSDLDAVILYGGNSVTREKNQLSNKPQVVISTPGRFTDHMSRGHLDDYHFGQVIIDEYDKMLEVGFKGELTKIFALCDNLRSFILNSATPISEFPDLIDGLKFNTSDYSGKATQAIKEYNVIFDKEEKLETLLDLMFTLKEGKKIIFTSHRERADAIYSYLSGYKIPISLFHGGLEQNERERELIRFEHESSMVLVCTDLGGRGIDIEDVQDVIHYQISPNEETRIHRNGRVGRMGKKGYVYYMVENGFQDKTAEHNIFNVAPNKASIHAPYETLFVRAGKKQKIRKMDILGFVCKTANIDNKSVGKITVKDNYSYVSVTAKKAEKIKAQIDNQKLKNRKVRVSWCNRF